MSLTLGISEREAILSEVKKLLRSGADYELVLRLMRDRGFNKIASIKTMVVATGMPLGDAKALVHNSSTWQDVYTRDEKLHQQLDKIAEELQAGGQL